MTIREKGYIHWDGEFLERKFPWWPITRTGIKLSFKKKYFKFLFFFSFVPAFVFIVGIYISERLEDFQFMVRGSSSFLKVNPLYFKHYFTGDFLLFLMVMILVFAGAPLISDDLRHNSLQLYFSRPLRKIDYLLGKASVLFFFLLMYTLVPGLLFIIMKLLFAGDFKFFTEYPWLLLSVISYSLLVTVFFCMYTLLLSSLSKNRRYVSILIFALYIFSDVLFGIFFGIFRDQHFALLSLKNNLQQVGAFLFGQRLPYNIPIIYSFSILTAISVLAAFILKGKAQGVEVIK